MGAAIWWASSGAILSLRTSEKVLTEACNSMLYGVCSGDKVSRESAVHARLQILGRLATTAYDDDNEYRTMEELHNRAAAVVDQAFGVLF